MGFVSFLVEAFNAGVKESASFNKNNNLWRDVLTSFVLGIIVAMVSKHVLKDWFLASVFGNSVFFLTLYFFCEKSKKTGGL